MAQTKLHHNSPIDDRVKALEELMAAAGYPIVATSKKRTAAEQAALYEKGRTKPGSIVTEKSGKPGEESKHQLGDAHDYAFIKNGQPNYDEDNPWDLLGEKAKEVGLEWGGDWTTLVDRPHVQQPNRATFAKGGPVEAYTDPNSVKVTGPGVPRGISRIAPTTMEAAELTPTKKAAPAAVDPLDAILGPSKPAPVDPLDAIVPPKKAEPSTLGGKARKFADAAISQTFSPIAPLAKFGQDIANKVDITERPTYEPHAAAVKPTAKGKLEQMRDLLGLAPYGEMPLREGNLITAPLEAVYALEQAAKDVARPMVEQPMATSQGMLAGSIEGLTSLTPADIIPYLTGKFLKARSARLGKPAVVPPPEPAPAGRSTVVRPSGEPALSRDMRPLSRGTQKLDQGGVTPSHAEVLQAVEESTKPVGRPSVNLQEALTEARLSKEPITDYTTSNSELPARRPLQGVQVEPLSPGNTMRPIPDKAGDLGFAEESGRNAESWLRKRLREIAEEDAKADTAERKPAKLPERPRTTRPEAEMSPRELHENQRAAQDSAEFARDEARRSGQPAPKTPKEKPVAKKKIEDLTPDSTINDVVEAVNEVARAEPEVLAKRDPNLEQMASDMESQPTAPNKAVNSALVGETVKGPNKPTTPVATSGAGEIPKGPKPQQFSATPKIGEPFNRHGKSMTVTQVRGNEILATDGTKKYRIPWEGPKAVSTVAPDAAALRAKAPEVPSPIAEPLPAGTQSTLRQRGFTEEQIASLTPAQAEALTVERRVARAEGAPRRRATDVGTAMNELKSEYNTDTETVRKAAAMKAKAQEGPGRAVLAEKAKTSTETAKTPTRTPEEQAAIDRANAEMRGEPVAEKPDADTDSRLLSDYEEFVDEPRAALNPDKVPDTPEPTTLKSAPTAASPIGDLHPADAAARIIKEGKEILSKDRSPDTAPTQYHKAPDWPDGPEKRRLYELIDKEKAGTLTGAELKEAQALDKKFRNGEVKPAPAPEAPHPVQAKAASTFEASANANRAAEAPKPPMPSLKPGKAAAEAPKGEVPVTKVPAAETTLPKTEATDTSGLTPSEQIRFRGLEKRVPISIRQAVAKGAKLAASAGEDAHAYRELYNKAKGAKGPKAPVTRATAPAIAAEPTTPKSPTPAAPSQMLPTKDSAEGWLNHNGKIFTPAEAAAVVEESGAKLPPKLKTAIDNGTEWPKMTRDEYVPIADEVFKYTSWKERIREHAAATARNGEINKLAGGQDVVEGSKAMADKVVPETMKPKAPAEVAEKAHQKAVDEILAEESPADRRIRQEIEEQATDKMLEDRRNNRNKDPKKPRYGLQRSVETKDIGPAPKGVDPKAWRTIHAVEKEAGRIYQQHGFLDDRMVDTMRRFWGSEEAAKRLGISKALVEEISGKPHKQRPMVETLREMDADYENRIKFLIDDPKGFIRLEALLAGTGVAAGGLLGATIGGESTEDRVAGALATALIGGLAGAGVGRMARPKTFGPKVPPRKTSFMERTKATVEEIDTANLLAGPAMMKASFGSMGATAAGIFQRLAEGRRADAMRGARFMLDPRLGVSTYFKTLTGPMKGRTVGKAGTLTANIQKNAGGMSTKVLNHVLRPFVAADVTGKAALRRMGFSEAEATRMQLNGEPTSAPGQALLKLINGRFMTRMLIKFPAVRIIAFEQGVEHTPFLNKAVNMRTAHGAVKQTKTALRAKAQIGGMAMLAGSAYGYFRDPSIAEAAVASSMAGPASLPAAASIAFGKGLRKDGLGRAAMEAGLEVIDSIPQVTDSAVRRLGDRFKLGRPAGRMLGIVEQ